MPDMTLCKRVWLLSLLATLALLLLGCTRDGAASPGPQSLVLSKVWWMDRSHQAELPTVLTVTDWQDFKDWNSLGFGAEPVWVRLRLAASPATVGQSWLVRSGPAFLDHVTLFDPVAKLTLQAGDAIPPSGDDLMALDFSFEIPAMAQERDIYLRIESSSARTLYVDVQPYRVAKQNMREREWLLGFILSASTLFSIWAAVQWWHSREKVMGVFAVKQLLSTLWAFFFLGFARVYLGPLLEPGVLTAMASALIPWVIASVLWFMGSLIATYHPSKTLLRMCFGLAAALSLLPLVQWAGLTRATLWMCNVLVPFSLLLLLVTLYSAWHSQTHAPIRMRYLLAYLWLVGMMNTVPSATFLGLIEGSPIVLISNLNHTVLDSLVVFVMLQLRSGAMQRAQHETALQLVRSQEHMAAEKRLREEQSQLFSMLAHEMKTPLATLRMWLEAGQPSYPKMARAITDMNLVIERCVLSGQLNDQGLQPMMEPLDAAALTLASIQSCREPERLDFVQPPGLASIQTDAQMLSIVLSNLIDNACKYGKPGSRVRLVLEPWVQGSQLGWRWRVTNSIDSADLPNAHRLFEKYYRSAKARRQSGSGLGLFLVQGLLGLMQGCIGYEPSTHEVSFWVWLPTTPAPRAGNAAPRRGSNNAAGDAPWAAG